MTSPRRWTACNLTQTHIKDQDIITDDKKSKTRERAALYVQRYPSQNMAANSLKGISAATLSNIINGKWNGISEEMWLCLESQLVKNEGWQIYVTRAYRDMTLFLGDSQAESSVMWITAPAGTGKSTAGMSVREAFQVTLKHLVTLERPLLIFDEADKLSDSVIYYFISIYNALEDRCGIVFLSTAAIKKRIRLGIARDKKGYDELESRIGRRFVDLSAVNAQEVEQICYANGLQDRSAIQNVKADAAQYWNDLRRVKRAVHRELRRLGLKAGDQNAEED